jgi:hypothetical protein
MNDLPNGYLIVYGADEILLASPEGKAWTYPPDTDDVVLWERAWEHAATRGWECGDVFCWVCAERRPA